MKAIELNNVSVFYDNVCALKDINLDVEEGQFLGIIGPNGGGKTTLLKVILGLIKPFKGEVRVFSKKASEGGKLLAYVPQASSFDRTFPINVLNVVLMGKLRGKLDIFHRYSNEEKDAVLSILNELAIFDIKDRQIGELSGGQLQKVLIARALAVEPKIILLDEPTASLDANSSSQIYFLLKKLNEEITVLVVTHDMSAVSSYFENIACLNRKLYYHGSTEITQGIVDEVYGCPIDLIAHGVPHRVLGIHKEEYDD
jgi:zinc transport system ATP-binding protein